MPQIISIHSFRRGTGKSTIAVNVAAILAQSGQHVGIVDVNLPAPSLHVLFGLKSEEISETLNDFIWGKCGVETIGYDVMGQVGNGRLILVPASTQPSEIQRIMRGGYYIDFLIDACHALIEVFDLELLLVDTFAGIHEETQIALAISDTAVVVMRPDEREFAGTQTILKLASRLDIEHQLLVVNELPRQYEQDLIQLKIARAFECEATAVFPHTDDLMALGSAELFVLKHPEHPLTDQFRELAGQLALNLEL